MSDPTPPSTGHPRVDQVLAELADLSEQPLGDHHDRLARVHEDLHRVLSDEHDPDQDQDQDQAAGRPGAGRPGV